MNYSMRKYSGFLFQIPLILVLGSIFLTGCGNDEELGNLNMKRQINITRSGTPVPFKADKENQGKRCEAKLFDHSDFPEENTPEYRRCLYMQKDLNRAARDGNIAGINKVLEKGGNVNGGYYNEGDPLGVAITNERTEVVRLLVENGAEINVDYNFGSTPLKRAVYYNFPEIAKILLENGADPCSKKVDDIGQELTALDIAKERGHRELISILKAAGADDCP